MLVVLVLMTESKMKTLIVTSVRNEESWILEWIAYHRVLGFDHFLFFTNDNTDKTFELLQSLEGKTGYVTVKENVLKEDESPQKTAFRKAVTVINDLKPEWVLCSDVDEYLVLKQHKSIDDFLAYNESNDAIAFNWKHFGSSGKVSRESGMTIERFIKCGPDDFFLNRMVKSIYKWNDNIKGFGPHRPWFKQGFQPKYVYPDGLPVGAGFWKTGQNLIHDETAHINFDVAAMHHYAIKSEEEYEVKKSRGNGMKSNDKKVHFRDQYFNVRDVNDLNDRSALNLFDEVEAELSLLSKTIVEKG